MSGWYGMVEISESFSLHGNSIPTIRLGGSGGGREELYIIIFTALYTCMGSYYC